MSPRTTEQYDKIRQQRKQQILDVALSLFANDGFHASSISKIAKSANISKGLMYNYFESKDDLLLAIVETGLEEMMSIFEVKLDHVLTDEEFCSLLDKLFLF